MVLSLLFDEMSIKEISIIRDINPRLKFLHVIEPPPKKLYLENIANFQGINTCFQNYSLRVNSKWMIYSFGTFATLKFPSNSGFGVYSKSSMPQPYTLRKQTKRNWKTKEEQ